MAQQNSVARAMHDVGLAAWFGGSLMGAVGVNGAAAEVDQPTQRARVANAGWARWTPVNMAAIVAHGIGALLLTRANRGRLVAQQGVASWTLVKTVLTLLSLAATGYSRVLGQRVISAGDVPVEGGAEPSEATPPDVANAQQQLRVLQWVIPALTGATLVVNARMGEQQRPEAVAEGLAAGVEGQGIDRLLGSAAQGALEGVSTGASAAIGALTGATDDTGDIEVAQAESGRARRLLRRR